MKRFTVLAVFAGALIASPIARGNVIYSTLNGTDGDSRGGNAFHPWLDDVFVPTGGILSEIQFSLIVNPFAGVNTDQVTDATVFIFADVDTEDSRPNPNDPQIPQFNGIDPLVFKQTLTNLTVPVDGSLATFSIGGLASQNLVIPDNASMWMGLTVSNNFNINMPLTGPVSVGSTDPNIYNFIEFTGQYSSSTPTPGPNTAGLALQLSVVPEPASLSILALGCGVVFGRRRR